MGVPNTIRKNGVIREIHNEPSKPKHIAMIMTFARTATFSTNGIKRPVIDPSDIPFEVQSEIDFIRLISSPVDRLELFESLRGIIVLSQIFDLSFGPSVDIRDSD